MKTFIILVTVCFVVVSANLPQELQKSIASLVGSKVKTYWQECMFENGLSISNIKEMFMKKGFKELGCVLACFHEKMGLVNEDGEVNIKAYINQCKIVLEIMKHEFNNEVKTLILDCNASAADIPDRCEKYMSLTKCIGTNYLEYFKNKNKKEIDAA